MKFLVLVVAAAAVGLCVGGPVDPQPRRFIYQVGSPSVRRYPVYPDRLLQPSPDQLKMAMEAIRLSTQPQENQRFNPNMLKPELMKPEIIQPTFGGPETMQPEITRPDWTKPEMNRPEMMQPTFGRPEMVQPEMTGPEMVQPGTIILEMIQRETMRPEIMETETIRPEMIEPETTRPEIIEPETTRPEIMEPETMRPEMIQPEAIRPETTQPETIKPEMTEGERDTASAPLTDPPMSLDETEQVDPFTNQSSVERAGSVAAVAAPADSSLPEETFLTQPVTDGDMVTESSAEWTEDSELGSWLTTLSPFGETHELDDPLDEMRETFQPATVTVSEDQHLTETIQEETATEFFTENDALFTA